MNVADSRQRDLFDRHPAPWELDAQREQCLATVVFAGVVDGEYDYAVPDSCGLPCRWANACSCPLVDRTGD